MSVSRPVSEVVRRTATGEERAAHSAPSNAATRISSVQFSSPGLTWCSVQALQDHDTVINVIDAVVAGTEVCPDL